MTAPFTLVGVTASVRRGSAGAYGDDLRAAVRALHPEAARLLLHELPLHELPRR